ncbi:MAG: RecX family transcriptional regulator [Coriobacteriia bacterium]|nr:RecX family transcriptional regulator [Coriobacteriia bacterium]MCL2746483.1 RecX family transcriptional regulator [Coriobacteriia bacterium]MCL2870640.1 RecX family transcriptional regulator [Coriobacteriia bacterium]
MMTDGACKEAAYEEARKCAHRIIKAREKTSHDLLKRLQEKGYSLGASEDVVKRFIEVGLVDDLRYTELYIRSAQYSCKGWSRIVRELRQRGIDTEYLDPPLEEDELERARAVIARLSLDTHKDRDKALRRLQNKGFSYGVAKQAISRQIDGEVF